MSNMQPSFDDLGTPLIDVTFCVLDLETTGTGTQDGITEIGAVKVRAGEVVGEFQTLINPETDIPAFITSLTSISNSMVADAPTISQVLPSLLTFAEGCVFVAHNAQFDIGFLKRACGKHGYPWPGPVVIDTVTLSRRSLLRDEVPNHRLGTLAQHFKTTVEPNHRALSDARATVDVLHGLLERVGSLGVNTLEELVEHINWVSPIRKQKRIWAQSVPPVPGVYFFVHDAPGKRQVLYVGKSTNLRSRVRTYFTASESRSRMDEMLTIATGVEWVECQTQLEAEILELRLIDAHRPRYNRRSKYPERYTWVKFTAEPFPRVSYVSQVIQDGARYIGPFRNRRQAEEAVLAIYETIPIRQCTKRLSATKPSGACALAEMGRCVAPCELRISVSGYEALTEQAVDAFLLNVRPIASALSPKLTGLVASERYEEAQIYSTRLQSVAQAGVRHHRLASLAACPQIISVAQNQIVHIFRYGRLAAAGKCHPNETIDSMIAALLATAESVTKPTLPASAALVEETTLIASYLENSGARLFSIDGVWAWPATVGLAEGELAAHALGRTVTGPSLN